MTFSRLFVLGVVFFGLVLVGLVLMRGELLALAMPLGAYWLVGLWLTPEKLMLRARRSLSTTLLTAGNALEIRLELENQGSSIDQFWLKDALPAGLELIDGQPGRIVALASGEKLELKYTVRVQRGVYVYDTVEVNAGDGLGLTSTVLRLPAEGTISVLPQAIRTRDVPLRPYNTMGYHGTIPARRGGSGVAFYGVRDYQPGDALRQINWRLEARHPDVLYSNEFQVDALTDVTLLLDGRSENYAHIGEASLFEYAIQAASSLALSCLNDGNRVALLAFGQILNWTLPGYGKLQAERIFHALATLRPGNLHNEIPVASLAYFVRPGSQVVVISPLTRWDITGLLQLRARRFSLLVVSPDPTSFEYLHLAPSSARELAMRIARIERHQLLQPLRQAGLLTLDWDVSQPLDQALSILRRNVLVGLPVDGGQS